MKLTVKSGALVEAASEASLSSDKTDVAGSRALYLRAVQKDSFLYAYSSNMKSRILTKITADVKVEGEVVIQPGIIPGILKGVPEDEDIRLELNDAKNQIRLIYKGGSKRLPASTVVSVMSEAVNKLPGKAPASFSLKGAILEDYCRRGSACAPSEDDRTMARPILCLSTKAGQCTATATDCVLGVRLRSAGKIQGEPVQDLYVCSLSMPALGRLLARRREQMVDVILGPLNSYGKPGEVFFRFGDVLFGARLLDGGFPDVAGFLDGLSPKYWCEVPVDAFKLALQRNAQLVSEKSWIKLEFCDDELKIDANSQEGDGDDQVQFEKAPDPKPQAGEARIKVCFSHLNVMLAAMRGKNMRIGLTNPISPIVIEDMNEDVSARYAMAGVTQ
jgi:DNA polymerase III sliding clamp (beta) subunit (PCNA family)